MRDDSGGRSWHYLGHFLVLGSLLFLGSRLWSGDDERVIRIGRTTHEHLRLELEAGLGRAPTPAESKAALDRWKLDEAVFREAKRLGILRDDPGVRAWVAQRAKDLYRGLEIPQAPSQQELDLFLKQNWSRYELPERFEFEQAFASREKGNALARAMRFKALADQGGDWAAQGDALDSADVQAAGAFDEIARTYGLEFATGVRQAPIGEVVVLESTRGIHAVRVKKRSAPELPAADVLRPRLLRDFQRSERSKERAFERLAARYRFVEEGS